MSDPREVRRVLISLQQADGSKLDVTSAAKLTTTSDVVRIDESGVIHPVKDGVATIEAAANGMTARFEVTVRGAKRDVTADPATAAPKARTVSNSLCAATTLPLITAH